MVKLKKNLFIFPKAIYQAGVFISRSSVNFVPIRSVWLLQMPAIIQIINAAFLSFVAIFDFVPVIYIVFAIILLEGLCGGAIYVNTFYLISKNFTGADKEFCLGATSQSYGIGIVHLLTLIGVIVYTVL